MINDALAKQRRHCLLNLSREFGEVGVTKEIE